MPRVSYFSWRRATGASALLILLSGCRSAPPASSPATPRPTARQQTPLPTATPRQTPRPLGAVVLPPNGLIQEIECVATRQKVFALTFDDGPDPTYTPQVLRVLKQKNVPATFFMVGKMVRAHPQTARLVLESGAPIGNHSWSHPKTSAAPVQEVERTDKILQSTLGLQTTLFRPPYGLLRNGLAAAAQRQGDHIVLWSCVGTDWDKRATSAVIIAKVMHRVKPGGIALLHDGGGNRSATIAALPRIIDAVRAKGYRFVTVPQLLKMGPTLPRKPQK